MSDRIDITAVIPTHDRSRLLPGAIRSLLDQRLPPDRYEVVVVDNASADSTRAVVEAFSTDRRVRYLRESRLGLAYARNAGWQAARGWIVAFLDDDARAGPDWLERIVHAFQRLSPRPGCVGGRVEAVWERPRPSWLGDPLLPGLTIVDWGPTAHVVSDLRSEWLVGANMAFPVELLRSLDGFDVELDRSGNRMLSSGDVYMTLKVQGAGYDCWYDPEITVRHHVAGSRLQKRWFMRRYYSQGLSDAAMERLRSGWGRPHRLKVAAKLAARLVTSPAALSSLVLPTENPTRFADKCFTLIKVGHIVGLFAAPGK